MDARLTMLGACLRVERAVLCAPQTAMDTGNRGPSDVDG